VNINATLIGQFIWFVLFIVFVMKAVWPYFQRVIAERQKAIAEGLAAAEASQKNLEEAKSRTELMIREARGQASHIVEQARRQASEVVEEAKTAAVAEGQRLIAAAKQQIEMEAARAREMLRKEAAALAVAGASKVLQREINAQAHADLLNKFVAQI